MLAEEGIDADIINIHTLKPLDEEAILASVKKKTGCAVSAEEHMLNGGLGDSVAQVLARNYPAPLEYVGVHDTFGESRHPRPTDAKIRTHRRQNCGAGEESHKS